MRALRAEQAAKQAQGFAKTRTSGHLLNALNAGDGKGMETPPTAQVGDYPAPTESMTEMNAGVLQNQRCTALRQWKRWAEDQGAALFNAKDADARDGVVALDGRQVMLDFSSRFRDGVFNMAAPSQFPEAAHKKKGGYLIPYSNTLVTDELEQQKSVMVVGHNTMNVFFLHCLWLKDVVDALRSIVALHFMADLQPYELTFFLGVSAASCTLWHTDSAEHEKAELKLTTLTLLSQGKTSMCIAGREEAWLKEPFDTVAFDPALYHRSGETYPHVVKLSIHWKLRSAGGSGSEAPGPSKPVKAVPAICAHDKKEQQLNKACTQTLDALEGEEGEAAERLRTEALRAHELAPNEETDKKPTEVMVTAEVNPAAKPAELLDERGAQSPMALMPVSNASRKRPAGDSGD